MTNRKRTALVLSLLLALSLCACALPFQKNAEPTPAPTAAQTAAPAAENTAVFNPREYYSSLFDLLKEPISRNTYAQDDGYSLVWSDEFDTDGAPDPTKWNVLVNYYWGAGAGEQEAYTDSAENIEVKDGCLILRAKHEPMAEREFTSARLDSCGKGDWNKGRICVRAKIPSGGGLWPAIWMMPTENYMNDAAAPSYGEIDFVEGMGALKDHLLLSLHRNVMGLNTSSTLCKVDNLHSQFHEYTLEWGDDYLLFLVDDIPYVIYNKTDPMSQTPNGWPLDRSYYLIMNLAVGGYLGGPVDESAYPAEMLVDYVRVYQKS